jgi:hypothetical protein
VQHHFYTTMAKAEDRRKAEPIADIKEEHSEHIVSSGQKLDVDLFGYLRGE